MYTVTSFDHVRLPAHAILGSPSQPATARLDFLRMLWRVGVGALCVSASVLPALKLGAYIAARYSQRRRVLAFRTQQLPIAAALADAFVLSALYSLGSICSLPFVPFVTDKMGRRWAILFGSVIMVIGASLQTAAQNCTYHLISLLFHC